MDLEIHCIENYKLCIQYIYICLKSAAVHKSCPAVVLL